MRKGSSPEERTVATPRTGRLAIAFQEPLTAVVRLKSARTPEFRAWIIKRIDRAAEQAFQNGYSADDVDDAKFAVVAFLDEAALYSENPALSNWKSVQAELYHSEDAGETFFDHLRNIQRRGNTAETADLLEIYAQCLLLGFQGKYRLGRWGSESSKYGSIEPILAQINKQVLKIREKDKQIQPWLLQNHVIVQRNVDPWNRRLILLLFCALVVSVLIFFGCKGSLYQGFTEMQNAVEGRQG